MSQYFLFGDLETGGLNGRLDNGELGMDYYPIFELAFIVTDSELNQVGDPLRIVVHQPNDLAEWAHPWAIETHSKSGLLAEVSASSISLAEAEQMVIDHLNRLGIEAYDHKAKTGVVFAGNSIMFDRSYIMCQMPRLHEYMHYRQLDISALALAARAWNPELERQAVEAKQYKHEALADIRESIDELRCYKEALTFVKPSIEPFIESGLQAEAARFSAACRSFGNAIIKATKGMLPWLN